MEKTATTKPMTNGVKKMTSKEQATTDAKRATSQTTSATPNEQMKRVEQILKPSGKAIVKRLQHAQILADKFEKMTAKYDDLTQFVAGKDAENSTMKFASESGYTFTLSNPATINKVLCLVEAEFCTHLEDAEKELLNFQIH